MITGWNKLSMEKSAKDTPAFKKLNNGIIKKFTQLRKAWAHSSIGYTTLSITLPLKGIVIASTTPAMVACTPDFKTKYQRTNPRTQYGSGLK